MLQTARRNGTDVDNHSIALLEGMLQATTPEVAVIGMGGVDLEDAKKPKVPCSRRSPT